MNFQTVLLFFFVFCNKVTHGFPSPDPNGNSKCLTHPCESSAVESRPESRPQAGISVGNTGCGGSNDKCATGSVCESDICKAEPNGTCAFHNKYNPCTRNYECVQGYCQCPVELYFVDSFYDCYPRRRVGEHCSSVLQNCVQNATCINSVCECLDGYYVTREQFCMARFPVGHNCVANENQCTENAACNVTTNTCQCTQGHVQRDKYCTNVLGVSGAALGDDCRNDACDEWLVCDNNQCKLRVGADCSGANSYQCPTGSTCQSDKCVCTSPLVLDPATGLCRGVSGAALGDDCRYDTCEEWLVCDNNQCKLRAGADCSGANSYRCAAGSVCEPEVDKCVCTAPLVPDPATGLCGLSPLVFGTRCELSLSHVESCANGTICILPTNENKPKCGCHQDHYFNGERCVGRVPAMFACTPARPDMMLSQDPCLPNASCHHRTHVCLCDAGYSLTGGRCLATSELIGK